MDKRLGFIGIIIEDRRHSASKVNDILSNHADIILSRTGLPFNEGHCCIINIIVKCTTDELGSLTGKLGKINDISVKSSLSKKSIDN